MFPWGTIMGLAGTGLSAGLSIINNKKAQRKADEAAKRQEAHYEALAAEDAMSRSDNQNIVRNFDRNAERQITNANNMGVITGTTPEYSLAVQKNLANARADLMAGISAGSSQRADTYNQKAEDVRTQKEAADLERTAARQETFANLANNAFNAFGSILDAYKPRKK